MTAAPLHSPDALRAFGTALLEKAGMEAEKAATVSRLLVEADLMGHTTHGLGLLPRYLDELEQGLLAKSGEPEVISDRGACVAWNGKRLSGLWLTEKAIDIGLERVKTYGTVSFAIRESHHIACLAVYLPRVTEAGCMAIIATSAPGTASVAPYGGIKPVYSPDPIAAGFPTKGDPVMIDISASITTNNMAARMQREGKKYEHDWLMDAEGNPSNDPAVLTQGGSILPAGGFDHGQKGYGWALLTEALTQGLPGYGRVDKPGKGMLGGVFIQVIDPDAFGGKEAFVRQTDHLAELCRTNPPRKGFDSVRLPGGKASVAKRKAIAANAVPLHDGIIDNLRPWAEKLGVAMPG
ncbi:Ldh family oxidoreductase [Acetobacteraceae bacterium H6797]|nr:Ldh family oxidoreductase [Acetobacteraceae bacterium H6797]